MSEFALIFRPTTAKLDEDTLARRNAAAREWALALRREGVLTAASPLDDGGAIVAGDRVAAVRPEHAIASVLVIRADSLDVAIERVKRHPGLQFGTEIEVRPVKAVAAP